MSTASLLLTVPFSQACICVCVCVFFRANNILTLLLDVQELMLLLTLSQKVEPLLKGKRSYHSLILCELLGEREKWC